MLRVRLKPPSSEDGTELTELPANAVAKSLPRFEQSQVQSSYSYYYYIIYDYMTMTTKIAIDILL